MGWIYILCQLADGDENMNIGKIDSTWPPGTKVNYPTIKKLYLLIQEEMEF
jgi:hypothetical protein